jgi:hypothetical protein
VVRFSWKAKTTLLRGGEVLCKILSHPQTSLQGTISPVPIPVGKVLHLQISKRDNSRTNFYTQIQLITLSVIVHQWYLNIIDQSWTHVLTMYFLWSHQIIHIYISNTSIIQWIWKVKFLFKIMAGVIISKISLLDR